MANELKHTDVGTQLTKAEWEAVGTHVLDSQATGDIIYASSATQLSRLGIGSAGNILGVSGGVPAWITNIVATSGILTLGGGDATIDMGLYLNSSGTDYYFAIDNSDSDKAIWGIGSTVGTTPLISIYPAATALNTGASHTYTTQGLTVNNGVNNYAHGHVFTAATMTHTASTARAVYPSMVQINSMTLTSGSGLGMDGAIGLEVFGPTEGANITLTSSVGIRVRASGGTPTNAFGIWIDAPTVGTSLNIGLHSDSAITIGTAQAANMFDDASNGAGSTAMYIGNAQITVASDVRIKRDIATMQDGYASQLLRQAPGLISFAWDDPSDRNPWGKSSRGRYVGWTAQEMIGWAPWTINAGDARDCLTCRAGRPCSTHAMVWQVEYEHLVPVLAQGWREHDGRIGDSETRIAQLETEIAELRRAT